MRLQLGEITFDQERRQLLRGAEAVRVSPKAFRLLEVLIEKRPKALSKSELFDELWPDTIVVEANLSNLVSELRAALGDDARKPAHVRTVHGYGYALAAGEVPARPAPPSGMVFRLLYGTAEIDLHEGENVFGRDPQASVWIADESISRRHAVIRISGLSATLADLGSKNGTFHRQRKIDGAVALADGDALAFGSIAMTFRVLSTTATTVTKA